MAPVLFVPQYQNIPGRPHSRELYHQGARSHAAKVIHKRRKQDQLHKLTAKRTDRSNYAWRHKSTFATVTESEASNTASPRSTHQQYACKQRNSGREDGSYSRDASVAALQTLSPFTLLSTSDPETISIFSTIVAPHAVPVYEIFQITPIFNDQWLEMMQQDVFFYAGSAALQSDWDCLQNPESSQTPSKKVLKYKVKALSAISQEIERCDGKVTDATLLGILYLAIVNGQFGLSAENEVHRTTLLKLIASRGGLEALGKFTKAVLLRYMGMWASPPSSPEYSPTYSPTLSLTRFIVAPHPSDQIDTLPEGFRALALGSSLPSEVVDILRRMNRVSKAVTNGTYSTHCRNHYSERFSSPSQPFTQASAPFLVTKEGREPATLKLLGYALTLYSATTFSGIPISNFISFRTRAKLSNQLKMCVKRRSQAEEDCLCWMWTVAVHLYKTRTGDLTSPGEEMREALFKRFPAMAESRADAEALLQKFFFHRGLLVTLQI